MKGGMDNIQPLYVVLHPHIISQSRSKWRGGKTVAETETPCTLYHQHDFEAYFKETKLHNVTLYLLKPHVLGVWQIIFLFIFHSQQRLSYTIL